MKYNYTHYTYEHWPTKQIETGHMRLQGYETCLPGRSAPSISVWFVLFLRHSSSSTFSMSVYLQTWRLLHVQCIHIYYEHM